jgi:hypothetical protein
MVDDHRVSRKRDAIFFFRWGIMGLLEGVWELCSDREGSFMYGRLGKSA